jgi:hypothetical protein
MADYASEGGHFYLPDGTPYYTVVGANGRERPTTLRDARKVGAYVGCTTIIRCAAQPGLQNWIAEQLLLASLTLPRLEGESEKSWLDRVRKDAKEEGKGAADRGTIIHGALERSRKGQTVGMEFVPWIEAVSLEIEKHCGLQLWKAEKSYAHKYGYGCKIDLHSADPNPWVIDYKGKDDDKKDDLELYDEHLEQLAACRLAAGIPRARCAIVFFGRQTPWAKFVEADEDDLVRGWEMFSALLTFWQAKNRMDR